MAAGWLLVCLCNDRTRSVLPAVVSPALQHNLGSSHHIQLFRQYRQCVHVVMPTPLGNNNPLFCAGA
jgi:hypothetical protein